MRIRKRKDGKIFALFSDTGYNESNKRLATIKDNDNGYTVIIHSWRSSDADRYFSLEYPDLEYLSLLHDAMNKQNR